MSPSLRRALPACSLRGSIASVVIAAAAVILFNYARVPGMAVVTAAFGLLAFAVPWVATGRWRTAATVAASGVVALHLFGRLKIYYYKDPLTAGDINLVTDTGNWETLLHYPVAGVASVALIAMLLVPWFLFRDTARRGWRERVGVALAAVAVGGGAVAWASRPEAHAAWLNTLPKGACLPANLVFSALDARFSPPVFPGDAAAFAARVAAETFPVGEPAVKPDIVVMLQESTVNPELFNLKNAALPRLDMFNPVAHGGRQALFRVHTFGGGTWRTEFDVLSGLACTDFGANANAVFYAVTPHLRTALPAYLRAHGYLTVALTPFNKGAYHAASAYADLGFEQVVQPQDLGYPGAKTANLWHITSADMATYALKVLKQHTDRPVFVYCLTMKEHGPYDAWTAPAYGLDKALPAALAGKMTDYVDRLVPLDKAVTGLKSSLDRRARPYLFAYFGDHQPGLGYPVKDYAPGLVSPDFLTQVVVTGNTGGLPPMPPFMTSNLLAGYLVEAAALPPDDLLKASITLRRLTDGKVEDAPDRALVDAYHAHIHGTLGAASR